MSATDDPDYTQPTPRLLYVHDDLTAEVAGHEGADSPAALLARDLLERIGRDPERVRILTLGEQVERVVGQGDHAPFALALGIGAAGQRVAETLHARAGWFPRIRRIGLTREDTVFSGLTMRALISAPPEAVRRRTRAFCLRGVAESIAAVAALCPVTAGVAAPGHRLDDVSFINASGLVRRVAIRRPGQPPLAFFDRPEWIRAWFPGAHAEILAICQRLNALIEPVRS